MPDLDTILRLVAEGAITPEEAEQVLAGWQAEPRPELAPQGETQAHRLRIEVHERGRRVVNLSLPLNIAGLAGQFLPGLSDEVGERIQSAIRSGLQGHIVDVSGDDGDRVLIVSE